MTPQAHPTLFRTRWFALLTALVVMAVLTGCDTQIPTPPAITVVITAVDDTEALAQGVSEALTSTAQVNIGLTETVLAQGGVTLTPSNTPTITPTPTATVTRFFTATPTPVPSATLTPTFSLLSSSSVEQPAAGDEPGWLRFAHAWRNPGSSSTQPVDVYLNDQRVAVGIDFGSATTYYRIQPGAVQVTIRPSQVVVDANSTTQPLASVVVGVSPGSLISVVAANFGQLVELLPVVQDPSPVASDTARLQVLQANSALPLVDMLVPNIQRALGFGVDTGALVGPFNVPSGSYSIDLYDVTLDTPQFLFSTDGLQLLSRVNYLLVLTAPERAEFGSSLLFSGVTRRLSTDVGVRFVNLASQRGALNVYYQNDLEIPVFPVGGVSEILPLPKDGLLISLTDSLNRNAYDGVLDPLPAEDRNSDQLIMITEENEKIVLKRLSQNAPPSVINANLRLIHALPDTRPLSLEIRRVREQALPVGSADTSPAAAPTEEAWINLGQAEFTNASAYLGRAPGVYDVRVLLSGTRNVIGEMFAVQMSAGGTYDFMVVPGTVEGSVNLMLLQPSAQIARVEGNSQDQATAVFEAVAATLTAQSPEIVVTPIAPATPTATRTPPPTNTPRPTNTPDVKSPVVQVDPAPPNTASTTLDIFGQDFAGGVPFIIRLDDSTLELANGVVNNDGSFSETIELPENLPVGPHVVRICADCRPRGAQQEVFAVFVVAPAEQTPTATVRP